MTHRIGIIGGDGIGPDVIAEGLKVIGAAGVELETVGYDLGGARYGRDGTVLPDETIEEWRSLDALYLGAVGTPEVPPGVIADQTVFLEEGKRYVYHTEPTGLTKENSRIRRERSISAPQERYHVDQAHGAAVEATAIAAWQQVAAAWDLDTAADEDVLRWACRLHEIGLTISHSQYHKHGAYLLRYSDLPGFTQQFQKDLATLVRGHRRKFSAAVFEGIEEADKPRLRYLCILVRLAVLIQHPRNLEMPPAFSLHGSANRLKIMFPTGWLDDRPLTLADLQNEQEYLSKQDFVLEIAGQ